MSDIKSSPTQIQKLFDELNIRWQALAILTALTFLLTILYNAYLDWDVANYLTIGQMMVQGDVPFVNIIDTNPPTIMYISAIPAWVSSITGISLLASSLLFFYSLVIALGLFFITCLKVDQSDLGIPYAGFWLTVWIMLSVWIFKLDQFGQREHLIFLFLASFIILRKARYEGKLIPSWSAIFSGFLVFLVVTMKPYYVIPLLLVESYYLVISRKFTQVVLTPEIYSLLISGVLYLVHFLVVPGMSDFFTYWVTFLSRGYDAYNYTWQVIFSVYVALPITWISLLTTGILALNLIFSNKKVLALENSFTLLGLGSLIVFIIQHKGWFYHSLCFLLSNLLGLIFLANRRMKIYTKQSFSFISNTLQVVILLFNFSILVTLYRPIADNQFLKYKETNLIQTIQALSEPKERVLFISYDIKSNFPDITYTERISAGRYVTSFPILFFKSNIPNQPVDFEWQTNEKKYYQAILEDFNKYTPNLVLIDMIDRTVYDYLNYRNFFNTTLHDYYCIGKADTNWILVKSSGYRPMGSLKKTIQHLYEQHSLESVPGCSDSSLDPKRQSELH